MIEQAIPTNGKGAGVGGNGSRSTEQERLSIEKLV